jgi:propionyl-CoA synthetase
MATMLQERFGVQKGDTVVIYMPMIAEACFAMLACARIGATHSVVFGGFAPKELANRIDHCKPKLIITASAGIEPNKVILYAPLVDEALSYCTEIPDASAMPRLIVQREDGNGKYADPTVNEHYHDYNSIMRGKNWAEAPPARLPGDHPLYILYTSGTTGAPKGIVRDIAGTCVGTKFSIGNSMNLSHKSVHFASSDIGWIVGHSFMVYGPLLHGCSTVFYEGKPVTPDAGAIWRVCAQYGVTSAFMAPTAVRVIKKEDFDGTFLKKYKPEDLQVFGLAGERCDPDTIYWLREQLPKTIINDTWWQTESGHVISGNITNVDRYETIFPTLPGSATKPFPGFDVKVFNDDNTESKVGDLGKIVVKLPMAPSFMQTLWGSDELFIEKYLAETPGYYTTGDSGAMDENGYLHIMTRVDDVINVAGHRISTGRIEEVVNDHTLIVESAVVAFNDELKGETPLAFVILRGNPDQKTIDKLTADVKAMVRADCGAFCSLSGVIPITMLPKTRSGKILRGTMKSVINGYPHKVPATIEDYSALDLLKEKLEEFRQSRK